MGEWTVWDWALMAGVGFVAVTSLVRLMQRQRQIVLAKLESEVALEKQRQDAEQKAKAKEKMAAGSAGNKTNKK